MHRIDVPELFPLPDESGAKMLWRNPEGFSANSGEYGKINIPWLRHGQHEWHPISLYLREDTHADFEEIFRNEDLVEECRGSTIYTDDNQESSLKRFVIRTLEKGAVNDYLIAESRTSNRSKFNTTQVFTLPAGDWTKQVYKEVVAQTQRRNIWVKGPYVSPYTISGNFNNLVMLATGIGITPALAVMNQYAGFSRFKILVWSTRSKNMLKFFIPQMKNAHLAIVYYTGEDLTEAEVQRYTAIGNIYIEQKRAHFPRTIDTVVPLCTDIINCGDGEKASADSLGIKEMPMQIRDQWCVLYCGGGKKISHEAEDHCKHVGIHYEYELFDW